MGVTGCLGTSPAASLFELETPFRLGDGGGPAGGLGDGPNEGEPEGLGGAPGAKRPA